MNRHRAGEAEAWQSVHRGVGVFLAGHLLYLTGIAVLVTVLLATLDFLGAGVQPLGTQTVVGATRLGALLALATGCFLEMVAAALWVAAPPAHGGRGLAAGCLALGTGALAVLGELAELLPLLLSGDLGPVGLAGPVVFLVWLEMFRLTLFPFFLRAVGLNLRAARLGRRALALGIGTGATCTVLTVFNLFLAGPRTPFAEEAAQRSLVSAFNLVVLPGILLWGSAVLLSARSALGHRLRQFDPPTD